MPKQFPFRSLTVATSLALLIILAIVASGASADGQEDEVPPILEKRELKHPNLGSHLNQLVASVEEGSLSPERAAADSQINSRDSVAVTIFQTDNVDEVVQFLEDNGGDPRNVGEHYIEAYVPVTLLGSLSGQPGVIRVREIIPPQLLHGPITSQGVQTHLVQAWHDAGYSGQGVKVGIIDGGFDGFRALVGSELPTPVAVRCNTDIGEISSNLANCENGSEHGTAVAEALIDIAPEVSLYLSNVYSPGDLQDTVDWMISQGVDVINTSLGFAWDGPGDGSSPFDGSVDYVHPFWQDIDSSLHYSPLRAVDRAVDAGIVWITAAGNEALKSWFESGSSLVLDGDGFVEFGPSDIFNCFPLDPDTRFNAELRWDDAWGGATRDLNFGLWDTQRRAFVLRSTDPQSGDVGHFPYEYISANYTGSTETVVCWVVLHVGGSRPDWIQLQNYASNGAVLQHYTGEGSIENPAESTNPGLLAVGATHYWDTSTIADYSSRGPTPDGRVKPDIVGTACAEADSADLRPPEFYDGNNCWFAGTSQASPHVAGLAALVRQKFPDYTPQQVAQFLKDNAEERGDPGADNTWGSGFALMPPPETEPGAPTIGSVSPGQQSLTVAWTAPDDDGGATITAYDLRHIRSDAPDKADANWTVVAAGWTSGSLEYTITGLEGGVQHDVQVRAFNSVGSGPWSDSATGITGTTPLLSIAAQRANGPGAIYVGDLEQLVGPAPETGLGGIDAAGSHDGRVPLDSLERHRWLYESSYYRELLDRAKFTNPTPLSSSGEKIVIRHACINRALLPCQLLEAFFVPNLAQRTGGQVEFQVTSFPELGVAGPATLSLIADGTLDSATVHGGIVAGEIPAIDIQSLWGVYSSSELEFKGNQAIMGDIEDLVLSETGGVILNHSWFSGDDQYLFCKEPVATVDDFNGRTTRSHSESLSHWINGMGGQVRFVAFVEVYMALENGTLDCAIIGPDLAYGQRWYEVVSYMIGPLVNLSVANNVVNGEVWESIPDDLQQMIIEEAAKSELEALRLASVQNETGVSKNKLAGLTNLSFSDELQYQSRQAALNRVIPGWIARVGDMQNPIFDVFNEKISPIVGIFIEENGTVNPCGETLSGDGAVSGTWAAGCDSEESDRGHARYFVFTLAEESSVTISLESADADAYLYLREGEAWSGAALHENNDHDDAGLSRTSDSQIRQTLAAGSYTIEATTYATGETGSFTLTMVTVGDALPGVTVSHAGMDPPAPVRIGTAILVEASFTKAVTGFTVGDVTVGNGTAGNFQGSGAAYTFEVTPDDIGQVTVDIAANVAEDADGNGNGASEQLQLGIPYDDNRNGVIERSEVIKASRDYRRGDGSLTRSQLIALMRLYSSGQSAAQPPGPPRNLTAMASGPTGIDLSWSAPASDGGSAVTGYRIEVSHDGSSWSDLVADTNSTATSYSHTGLTLGDTRHYRVSGINSAGTGPASGVASATTTGQSSDLVVESPAVDNSSPAAGASFTLSATVRNRGEGPSASTTLRYYQSSDSTISSSDTELGADSVSGLDVSASRNESISLTAPSVPGTYYYGACVDSVSGESDTANNCSSAVAITVGVVTAEDYDVDNDGLIEVSNLTQLNAIRWDLDGDGESRDSDYTQAFPGPVAGMGCPSEGCSGYELVGDLDFDTNGNGQPDAGDAYWNDGAGWMPIDIMTTFDGGGHTLSNLYIKRSGQDKVGLFGDPFIGIVIRNVGLLSVDVTGRNDVGGLVGEGHTLTVTGSYTTGTISGASAVGGLIGDSFEGTVADSYSTASVNASGSKVGGLIGASHTDTIANSYATGAVSGDDEVGGLIGDSNAGSTMSSYATGDVAGSDSVGGLIGASHTDTIANSYATGAVSGDDEVGGLVGGSYAGSTTSSYATGAVTGSDSVGGLIGDGHSNKIAASYATGDVIATGDEIGGLIGDTFETTIIASFAGGKVTGDASVGGLVGNLFEGSVTASYATGFVSGNETVGGLIGLRNLDPTVSVSYWDSETSGQSGSDGGIHKTTTQLQSPTGYTGIFAMWNVDVDGDGSNDDPWDFGTSSQYPALKYGMQGGAKVSQVGGLTD